MEQEKSQRGVKDEESRTKTKMGKEVGRKGRKIEKKRRLRREEENREVKRSKSVSKK